MAEPVSIEELKRHLEVERDDQDDMIVAMGAAAREWVENYTGLTITAAGVTQTFAGFDRMPLVVWPEDGAAVTVSYVDEVGDPAEITGARLWRAARPARVLPPAGSAWPTRFTGQIAVTVAGVPASLCSAIKLVVGNLYANRESTVTGTIVADTGAIENLCRPYRMAVIG